MQITKLGCSIKVPTQVFGNEVLWVEYELEQGEDPNAGLNAARQLCWENHRAANPHLYQDQEVKVTDIANAIVDKKQRPKNQIDAMIFDMQSVTDLTVLKSYELLCKNNPKLQETYQSKLKELNNE
jgi:hypothetical protein